MYRWSTFFLLTFSLTGQAPPSALDKPPQDVDDALRARIKTFYDYHVERKYRSAEQLVAEESKDDFYVMSKPEVKTYRIGDIQYSDNFTKAKVMIVGSMQVLFPWAGGKMMDIPFPSYWKIENGVWCWYYNKDAARHTPFGDVKERPANAQTDTPSGPPGPNMTPEQLMASVQSAVKLDRNQIDLVSGKPQTIKVMNTLPGVVSLSIDCPRMPIAQSGISASFDKRDLKANETAVLTLDCDSRMKPGATQQLRITVSPTNQVLDLTVKIAQ